MNFGHKSIRTYVRTYVRTPVLFTAKTIDGKSKVEHANISDL
ncbi:hypothetical protein [Borreliella valaisiana]|nr:hypothetical protein [Borreliella valaisiana]